MVTTDVVSAGDLQLTRSRDRRAAWMEHFDVGKPPVPHPAPVLGAQLFDPTLYPAPDAAMTLLGWAEFNGWSATMTYARGTTIDARGRAGRVVDSLAIRMWRFPDRRAVALWEDGSAAGGWLWRVGQLPRPVGLAAVKLALDGTESAPKPEATRGACQVCAQLVVLNKNGTLRVHGPKDDRCHGGRRVPVAT